jgi:hypothetical protein
MVSALARAGIWAIASRKARRFSRRCAASFLLLAFDEWRRQRSWTMHRLFLLSALLSLCSACAFGVTKPPSEAHRDLAGDGQPAENGTRAASATPAAAASAPITVVDIEDFASVAVCKDVTKPGTRIVIGQQCYSPDDRRRTRERERDFLLGPVETAMREQEQITRAARERDLQRSGLMRR